jgi:hypothetical protein
MLSTVSGARRMDHTGQVVAEIGNFGGTWGWFRDFIQLGGQLLAVQQDAQVRWVHEDPVTRTKRMTDSS